MEQFAQTPQQKALGDLLVEVDAVSQALYGRGLRDTPGRTTPGFYSSFASGAGVVPSHLEYPDQKKKGGGRRRQRGGAVCDDNPWVKLAVDSAIILAGAAAVIGATYTGFVILQYYMKTYGLTASTVEIITALYNAFRTVFTNTIPGLASVAAGLAGAVADVGAAAGSVAIRTVTPLAGPLVMKNLYYNGFAAVTDAAGIVQTAYTSSRQSIDGVLTRAMVRKAEFERAIAAKSERMQAALTQLKDSTIQGGFATAHRATRLSDKVCALIDNVAAGVIRTVDIAGYIAQMLDVGPIGPGQGGKYRKRTMHRSKKRRASRKRMSRRY